MLCDTMSDMGVNELPEIQNTFCDLMYFRARPTTCTVRLIRA